MTTTHASHKAELRRQLRTAITAARKKVGPEPNTTHKGKRYMHWSKKCADLADLVRLLDVLEAIPEGAPLPLGWQDLRLPKR